MTVTDHTAHRERFCAILALSISAIFFAGCSSTPQTYPDYAKSFPSEQRLIEIAQTSPEDSLFRDASKDGRVPHWKLAGPLPATWGSQTVRSTTPVGQKVDEVMSTAKMTESMTCYAREAGLFYAHYERYPYETLRDFIADRCGTVSGRAGLWLLGVSGTMSEAEIASDPSFGEWVGKVADGADREDWEYGVWKGAGRNGTFVVVAANNVFMKVAPVPLDITGRSEVVLEGELTTDADQVFGLFTKGKYGYGECVTNTAVELPRFRIVCKIDKGDPSVAVSLARGRDEDVFASFLASPRFWLTADPPKLFVAPGASDPTKAASAASPAAAATPGASPASPTAAAADYVRPELIEKPVAANNVSQQALQDRFLTNVNRVRAQAGYGPLLLEEQQSEANRKLAPYIFARQDEKLANDAFLGAIAGWKVNQGDIINGSLTSASFHNADVDDMVVSMLAEAQGRRTLLDELADSTAVGVLFDQPTETVGLIVTSYEFTDDLPHVERVNRFLDKLAKARSARGASPPRKVSELKPIADSLAARVASGEIEFGPAAQELLDRSFKHFQDDTLGFIGAAHDPLHLEFSDEILTMEPLRIAIMVTPFKPEGSPWHIYGVAIVYPKTQTIVRGDSAAETMAARSEEQDAR